jgi:hypothetical protein
MKRELTFIFVAASLAIAQTETQIPAEIGVGKAMQQNSEALKQYTYKRRTAIQVKGQPRGERIELVRYVDGKIETVPIEAPPPRTGRGGLRGKIIEKKIEKKKDEMKEERERLENLLHTYLSPGSHAMQSVLQKAAISRTGTGPDADIKVVATGVSKPSDSFTLIWNVANRRPVSIDIHAELDGKPVRLTGNYAALPGGPFYAAHTVISAPRKDAVINIDTFDYELR